jgi:plasmid stabilization system protein ParE
VAEVTFASRALADLERIFEFLATDNPPVALATVQAIRTGVEVLASHPFIGRPAARGRRELILSRGKSGYVALYRYAPGLDKVLVLAIRHQREAGYRVV